MHLVTLSKLLGRPMRCQELDLVILMGPFQIGVLYDSCCLTGLWKLLRPDNLTSTAFYLLYPTAIFAAPSFIDFPFAVHQPFCHLKCFMRKGAVVINRQGRAVLLLPSCTSLLDSSLDLGKYVGARNNFKQSDS